MGALLEQAHLRTAQTMALNSEFRLCHAPSIRIRVEIPDRHGFNLGDVTEFRLVLACLFPLRIFFIEGKGAFEDTGTEESDFESRIAQMLTGFSLFQLIMHQLFHIQSGFLGRFERG